MRIRIAGASLLLLGLLPAIAHAGGPAPAAPGCASPVVCSTTLGIAITRQPGWLLLPPAKSPPGSLAFGTMPTGASGVSYTIRLIVEPYALTPGMNDARAAKLVAGKLIASERAKNAGESAMVIGGSPAVLIRGLPGPSSALDIVLVHRGAAYLIMAPTAGPFPEPDQQRALASLRFIQRHGAFINPAHG